MKENRPTHTLMDEQLLQQNIRITKNMTHTTSKLRTTHTHIHICIKTKIEKKDTHTHIHIHTQLHTL